MESPSVALRATPPHKWGGLHAQVLPASGEVAAEPPEGLRSLEYDVRRHAWLESLGYRVVRMNVSDIDDDLTEVTGRIYAELLERERIGFTRKTLRRPAGDTSP